MRLLHRETCRSRGTVWRGHRNVVHAGRKAVQFELNHSSLAPLRNGNLTTACVQHSDRIRRMNALNPYLLAGRVGHHFPVPNASFLLRLGHTLDSVGCAALPPLAEQRMRGYSALANTILEPVELVILLTGLGGGTGTGAAHEFARQARQSGALVLAVAAMPFEVQATRTEIARLGLQRLEHIAHVTVRLSLDRLARQARQQGQTWQMGAEWIEDLVDGLIRTLMKMGLINLDLMDLRAIVDQEGEATMLVGSGRPDDPESILQSAMMAPLSALDVGGASACLIQVEGGLGMTIGQVDAVANIFTEALDDDAQVILGARVSEDLEDTIRVVTLLAGIRPSD